MHIEEGVVIGSRARNRDRGVARVGTARSAVKRIARIEHDDDLAALATLVDEVETVVEELAEQGENAAGRRIARKRVLIADDAFLYLSGVTVRIRHGFG